MQVNQATLADLYKTFRVLYMEAYQGGPVVRPQFCTTIPAPTMEVFLKWLGAMPGMKKFLGELQIRNLAAHGFPTYLEKFADAVAVPEEDIENDTYGVYNPMMSAMGLAARQHPDELLANTMLGGFSAKCYTGKNFFDNNHEPVAGGQKFSNLHTYKLSVNSFRDARANIKNRKNAERRPMGLGIDLVLVVSPSNETLAKQIVAADLIAEKVTNAGGSVVGGVAVSNMDAKSARAFAWSQLAGAPDAWFLLECGFPIKPFSYLENKATTFSSLTSPTSDHVFKKHEYLYQAFGRYNTGYLLPELAEGSDGSTAAL